MPLQDPRSRAIGYLVLRHLYDGDIIGFPIADADPAHPIFAELETLGLVARWDRVWPLHDRYRLSDRGIQAIEAVYRPQGAEKFFDDLRARNLPPLARRQFVQTQGFDPAIWGILHDPGTHWSTFATTGARYHSYLWEDVAPPRQSRKEKAKANKKAAAAPQKVVKAPKIRVGGIGLPHLHHHPHNVDLDQQVDDSGLVGDLPPGGYDVS